MVLFFVFRTEKILRLGNISFTEIHKYDMHKSVELQLNSTKVNLVQVVARMHTSTGQQVST